MYDGAAWQAAYLPASGYVQKTGDTMTGNLTVPGLAVSGLTGYVYANGASMATAATTIPIANGGTGQTTASSAFTALAPSQTGNAGKYLITNGTAASWETTGASAGGVIWENSLVVSSAYTLTTDKNGLSVGPITISSGASVTVPSGQRWLVL